MPTEATVRKFRIDKIVEAFQWNPNVYHPLVHELDGAKYVVGSDDSKHWLKPGCWVVYDPMYRTACVVGESYFLKQFTAVEIKATKSMRESMTDREWRALQRRGNEENSPHPR